MTTWFLCKIGYNKQAEDGSVKKVKEAYLIDAISFTDAEARIYEEVGQQLNDFVVSSVSKINVSDVFRYHDAETWYKSKVNYITFDESKGKEKQITDMMFVTANSLKQAYDRIVEKLGTVQLEYEIIEIAKSPVLEVFNYKSPDERIGSNLKPLN